MRHLTWDELEAGLEVIRQAPADDGTLELIVRRPAIGVREILEVGELDLAEGLVGDTWIVRGSSRTPDRTSHPDMQLNIMSTRAVALVAQDRGGRAPASAELVEPGRRRVQIQRRIAAELARGGSTEGPLGAELVPDLVQSAVRVAGLDRPALGGFIEEDEGVQEPGQWYVLGSHVSGHGK